MTATEDRIIPRNPCRIRGGGDEKPPERPVLTIAQKIANTLDQRLGEARNDARDQL
jgi:hypothetical protein